MSSIHTKFLLILLLSVVSFETLKAQHYSFRTFSFNEGLSSYNADKIVQDKYGFLWITTQDGINRFDGKTFTTIKKNPDKINSLTETYVTDCKPDMNGNLWVGTSYGGLDLIDVTDLSIINRIKHKPGIRNSLISNWVRSICWDRSNNLWIATYSGISIYNPVKNTFDSVTENRFAPSEPLNVNLISSDPDKNIWVAVENKGIMIMDAGTNYPAQIFSPVDLGCKPGLPFFTNNFYFDPAGNVYVCTSQGIFTLQKEKNKYKVSHVLDNKLEELLGSKDVRCIAFDNSNSVWVGTASGLYHYFLITKKLDFIKHVPGQRTSLLDDCVANIFTDKLQNFWVVTTTGVNLLTQNKYSFKSFNVDPFTLESLEHVNCLVPYNDSLIFSCARSGLYLTNLRSSKMDLVLPAETYGQINTITRIESGEFMLSGLKACVIMKVSNNRFEFVPIEKRFAELSTLKNKYFCAILRINDSLMLFGSEEEYGLFEWNINKHSLKQYLRTTADTTDGIFDNHIHNIRKDRQGSVWLVSDLCLSRFNVNSKIFSHYFPRPGTTDSLNSTFLFDLYDDGRYKWLTTYGGGINRYDPASNQFTYLTEKDGLSANAVYDMLPENDSIFWVSSNKGLTRINSVTLKCETFYYEDGLQSNSFDVKAACISGNALYFGGIDGFTQITKSSASKKNIEFPVYINKVEYKTEHKTKDDIREFSTLNNKDLEFSPYAFPINFHVSALGYQDIHKYYYQYLITELDPEWIDNANSDLISFNSLPAGSYHLTVRVSNDHLQWNSSKTLAFEVLPKWYESIGFKLLVIVCIAGIIYSFYRYRIGQLKKEQNIRRDIASDLHDDIGSTLNSVKIFTNIAQTAQNKQMYFSLINDSLKEASAGLRDMIWVLDDSRDSQEDFFSRLKQFAAPLCEASGIEFSLIVDNLMYDFTFGKTEKRALFLIAKEAINNSVKYAGCKNIIVSFSRISRKKVLSITDDGSGFVEQEIRPGNGLSNMRQRARLAGYEILITSVLGKGTTIRMMST